MHPLEAALQPPGGTHMKREAHWSAPRQLSMVLGTPVLHGLSPAERVQVVRLLAHLLLEASGDVAEGSDDENA